MFSESYKGIENMALSNPLIGLLFNFLLKVFFREVLGGFFSAFYLALPLKEKKKTSLHIIKVAE